MRRDIELVDYLLKVHSSQRTLSKFGSFDACAYYADKSSIAIIGLDTFYYFYPKAVCAKVSPSSDEVKQLLTEPFNFSKEELIELAKDKISFRASIEWVNEHFEASSSFIFEDNYLYNWEELKDYFTAEGGSSRQSRKIFNKISRETTKVVKHVKDLTTEDISKIKWVAETWFKEFKQSSKVFQNYRHTYNMLTDETRMKDLCNLPCYVNLFYQKGELVAYDYLEIYPDVAIVPQGHSLIPSSWKYVTWHLSETAHQFGTNWINLGSTKHCSGRVALGMSSRDGGHLAEVKAQLPHHIEYLNVGFDDKPVIERTSRSTTLF
jgi:hypothetical protein